MNLTDIYEFVEIIGCLTFTTLAGDTMHSRIAHVCGYDDNRFYFLTTNVKLFYRQLVGSGKLAV